MFIHLISNIEKPAPTVKGIERRNLSVVILTVLLLCSALLNIVLARRIKDFNYAIFYLKAELSSARGLNPGDKAPPIEAQDIDGRPATIIYLGSINPSVVY